MAEDYPDYSPEYLVRHGKFKRAAWSGNAIPSGIKTLLTITGKGIIYGGFFYIGNTASCKTDKPYIVLDNTETSKITLEDRDKFNLSQLYSEVMYLLKYDDTNFCYVLGFCNGITFENKIEIKYQETSGRIAILDAAVYYALLE